MRPGWTQILRRSLSYDPAMAETRKHKITVRDELDAQLLAQMGDEPVRPYEAGEFHQRAAAPDEGEPDATPKPGVVGSFTFTTKRT